jgi:hypothetical protein
VLAIKPQLHDNTVTNRVVVNKLVKARQAAVGNILLPRKQKATKVTKRPGSIPSIKKNALQAMTKAKKKTAQRKPKATKTKVQPAAILTDITIKGLEMVVPTINLCGCHHGDLSALRSFTKIEATYYTRPSSFLDGQVCLDCKCAVLDMRPAALASNPLIPLSQ